MCLVVFLAFVLVAQADKEDNDAIAQLQAKAAANGYSFSVGMTSVSNVPLKKLCGLQEPDNWRETGNFDNAVATRVTLPSSLDWRTSGKVTPVKNQGSCGSCWSFGTIGAFEASLLMNGNPSEDLAEEWLLDCNSFGYDCNGGWWAFDDLTNGAPRESCYPYVGSAGSCNTSCTKYYGLSNWYYVGSSSGVPSTTDIKTALYTYGPLAVAVCVDSYFQNYNSGVFTHTSSGQVNHAVMLVGWDDANSCWIMKNSWGTGWGESGYMRIAYGANSIGYAACYAIPTSTTPPATDPYESNDTYSTAYGAINSGQNYADAAIASSSDEDWFHFTTADTGNITVSVTHESGADLDWYLYKSTDISTYVARGYTTSNPEAATYASDWAGKYYVKVVGYNGSTSTYTLNVTYPDTGSGGGSTYYRIVNRASGYSLDVNDGSSYVYHFANSDTYDKHWEFISVGDGYYKIINRYNGNALDVGSTNYAYNYPYNGNTDKHWQLIDLGTGYYRLVNRYNGFDLDTGSGSYVYVYTWNGGTDKQWQLVAVD